MQYPLEKTLSKNWIMGAYKSRNHHMDDASVLVELIRTLVSNGAISTSDQNAAKAVMILQLRGILGESEQDLCHTFQSGLGSEQYASLERSVREALPYMVLGYQVPEFEKTIDRFEIQLPHSRKNHVLLKHYEKSGESYIATIDSVFDTFTVPLGSKYSDFKLQYETLKKRFADCRSRLPAPDKKLQKPVPL